MQTSSKDLVYRYLVSWNVTLFLVFSSGSFQNPSSTSSSRHFIIGRQTFKRSILKLRATLLQSTLSIPDRFIRSSRWLCLSLSWRRVRSFPNPYKPRVYSFPNPHKPRVYSSLEFAHFQIPTSLEFILNSHKPRVSRIPKSLESTLFQIPSGLVLHNVLLRAVNRTYLSLCLFCAHVSLHYLPLAWTAPPQATLASSPVCSALF